MDSRQTKKIILRMSGTAKLIYIPTIIFSLLFAIASIVILVEALNGPSTAELGIAVTGVIFFGGGAILIARLMIRTAGYLDVREDGLVLDTYASGGFLSWENLTAIGKVRAMGIEYLGIAIDNVDSYVASKTQTTLTRFRDLTLAQGFLRFMLSVMPSKILNISLALFGYTKFPESPSEADILRWNKENMGYHILIPKLLVPKLDETIAVILSSQPTHPRTTAQQVITDHIPPGYKKCPMCAEHVKLDAKICRFCRHSFDA